MPVSIRPDSQVEMGEVGDTEGNKREIEYQNAKAYLLTQSVKSGLNLWVKVYFVAAIILAIYW